jgi:thiosulfate reductase cytochrome b subunit
MSENKRIYLQPLPVRIWHWLQAIGIVVLIITGAQIRYPEYINLLSSYKAAIYLHNVAGFLVIGSFVLWFVYYLFIAKTLSRLYIPRLSDLDGLLQQALFYGIGYFKGEKNPHHPTPENKFNPLQKITYLGLMFVFIPLVCISGILLVNLDPLRGFINSLGGLKFLAGFHFLLACGFAAFLPTHIYLTTLGHTPMEHIKTMLTGWEEINEEDEEKKEESDC